MRGFFRFSTRDMLILLAALGMLLAVLAPRWHQHRAETQAARARSRLRDAISAGDAAAVRQALLEEAKWGGGTESHAHYQEIQWAVYAGDPAVLDAMIGAGCDFSHSTYLERAVTLNRPEIVNRLASKVSAKDLEEVTKVAVLRADVESLEELLRAGAMGRLIDATERVSSMPDANRLTVLRCLLERRKAARESGHDDSKELAAALATVTVRRADPQYAELLIEFGAKPATR